MQITVAQRLRIIYSISGALSYASVLDIGRLWERLFHRAHIPLAYSQGFNPHPRMQFAAALAVGYTSCYEVLDIWVSRPLDADAIIPQLRAQCPEGLSINVIESIPLDAPSPQATLRRMGYRLEMESQALDTELKNAIANLMDSSSVVFERSRKGQAKDFDMRPLILDLRYVHYQDNRHIIELTLAFHAQGSIRPEEVIQAMHIAFDRLYIQRVALVWENE
ncbi:MAG: TIGR03936 family radical SAM-associated protein [Chloroflexi bacterium]|nr:TIGR03936 family radical SAM-associated protein [Chloroflexota bacterium]